MINTCPENETKVGSPKGRKGDPLSIVGIAIAIGIAVWQNRKTARAETALNTALSSPSLTKLSVPLKRYW